jgi:hypothetical protein
MSTVSFVTPGLIPIESFTTFGINSKPKTDNPLGKFGTGLKYSVAVILRLGGTIRVNIGLTEYVFYTKKTDFRGKTFDTVRMKKRIGLNPWRYEKLPFTTELGGHWEPWMAMRELESNTIDEGGYSVEDESTPGVGNNRTIISVHNCDDFTEAYQSKDRYFLDLSQKPLWEDDTLQIFAGENDGIFYRGLRVTDTRAPTLMTYNFKNSVTLTEDRSSKYPFLDGMSIRRRLIGCGDSNVWAILTGSGTEETMYEYSLDWDEEHPDRDSEFIKWIESKKRTTTIFPRLSALYDRQTKIRVASTSVSLPDQMWRDIASDLRKMEMKSTATKNLLFQLQTTVDGVSADEPLDNVVPF